ncbi:MULTISPECIES: winged helix-turn-helix domain-containing protein [Aeromonas]|uniref:winged helix-turn-helix domain-containing protein n=1 Tax=Aeromonas TaxID=642 RepID=UPI00084B94D9|nr:MULTISPECIES: winged helix-turn-helix domain-containing protein [Aeromonas]MDR5014416.1 winged helix-turn-helix domain-containing protein [Aeromonas veronii]OEC39857.1 hypothetical protein A9G06_17145 [Aeromonas sp. DNP9]
MRTSYPLGQNATFCYPKREIQTEAGITKLGGRESNILLLLLDTPNTLLSKQFINDKVWGNVLVAETSLTKAISNIRKALALHSDIDCELKTFPRQGYMLAVEGEGNALLSSTYSDTVTFEEPAVYRVHEPEALVAPGSSHQAHMAASLSKHGLVHIAITAFSASIITVLAEILTAKMHLF